MIEKKTCSQQFDHWSLQLAAYDLALPQCKTQLHRDRYAVQLRNDGTYRMCPGEPGGYPNPTDYDAFGWALALVWFQKNNGYKID